MTATLLQPANYSVSATFLPELECRQWLLFTTRRSYASAVLVLGVVILSVHPSVCLSVTRVLCD